MLFDHFRVMFTFLFPRTKMPTKKEQFVRDADELQRMLSLSEVECRTQNELSRAQCERALSKARRAVSANDQRLKAIAVNELRMALAMYKYTDALVTNLMMMESNLRMQGVTANFANMVERMSKLRIPAGTVDFNELTRKALRGLQPVDLVGVEEFTKSLIEASLSSTNTTSVADSELDDLINGRVTIDQALSGHSAPTVQTGQAAESAVMPELSQEASDDDLLRMLDEITESLKNGG